MPSTTKLAAPRRRSSRLTRASRASVPNANWLVAPAASIRASVW